METIEIVDPGNARHGTIVLDEAVYKLEKYQDSALVETVNCADLSDAQTKATEWTDGVQITIIQN